MTQSSSQTHTFLSLNKTLNCTKKWASAYNAPYTIEGIRVPYDSSETSWYSRSTSYDRSLQFNLDFASSILSMVCV